MEEYKLQGTHTYWDWAYINHIAVRHMHTFYTHTHTHKWREEKWVRMEVMRRKN